MTTSKLIAYTRQHLINGNKEAYIKGMLTGIRSAGSTRTANQYRAALLEDGFKV